jgi:hypothetical protein
LIVAYLKQRSSSPDIQKKHLPTALLRETPTRAKMACYINIYKCKNGRTTYTVSHFDTTFTYEIRGTCGRLPGSTLLEKVEKANRQNY